MPNRRLDAKAGFETSKKRRGKRDFGEKHQNLFVLPYRLSHSLKIGFGLAGTCHAIQHEGVEAAGANRLDHAVCCQLLRLIQCWRVKVR